MKPSKPFIPRQFTSRQWFWFLLFIALITRLPLLRLATAETTDGVWSLTYFSDQFFPNDRFVIFPGYPFLLWLGQKVGVGGWMLGRVVSFLAGLFLLIPIWNLCRRWISLEMTGVVCVMALLSPLSWFWSLKVMPDMFFTLAFWVCLERLAAAYSEKSEKAWWMGTVAGAISACMRPEGFLLFPWVVLTGERLLQGNIWIRRSGFILIWAGPLMVLKPMFFTILDAYREGMGLHPASADDPSQIAFLNVVDHFYAYLSQPLFVFTPLVYWFAILGLGKMTRRTDEEGQAFRKVLLQVLILLFLTRLFPVAYQDRYLLPFLPLILVAAGVHLENFFEHWKIPDKPVQSLFWKNGVLTLCFAWSTLYSAAALIAQSDSFGDVKRSSEFIQTLPPDVTLYSDEVPKTTFWSGRKVIRMGYLTENTPFQPKPGDYVVLHSCYTPRIWNVDRNMRDRFGAFLLHQDSSMVVPIMTDLMEDQKLQNRVGATALRFQPQFFTSLVYRIDGKKGKRKP
jgi:hypothetical protein